MKRTFAALLAATSALGWSSSAAAAIGTPVDIGSHYQATGSATNTVTIGTGGDGTHSDAPAATLIIVPTAYRNTTTFTGVADNALLGANCGGAYTPASSAQIGSFRGAIYYCPNTTNDLASGQTVVSTFAGSAGNESAMVIDASGLVTATPVDVSGDTSGTSTTSLGLTNLITPTHGTDTNGALAVACVWITNAATADAYAEDTADGWTAFTVAGSTSNILQHCAWQKVTTNAALTWNSTWSNARSWSAWYAVFKSAGGGAAAQTGTKSMMGFGH